nr:MAG TPA: hypothetical protein [Caudoviricetes sp.]
MNTVLLLFVLSAVLDVKANQALDRIKRGSEIGWTLLGSAVCTASLSVVAFAAGVVKWCLL